MEEITQPSNMNRAYKKVKANRGSAGVDDMNVDELLPWIRQHKESLIDSLLTGDYRPHPVRGVEIPKPGKNRGVRQLGIPTVVDRLVQQAIQQVLEPILDPTFSESSYGFRPGRSAAQALQKAREYVSAGYETVVDLDLEKFFDKVNHDVLMSRLAKRIKDKRLLKIVRRFLEADIMKEGTRIKRREGMPQGGPLSPLMSNLLLDELDKELEHRGHKFCRYADDANIYVRSERAGERVKQSVTAFIWKRLKLKVNEDKSASASVEERQFLGYRLLRGGKLVIAQRSLNTLKDKVRKITTRNRAMRLDQVIRELNVALQGWVSYFRLTQWPGVFTDLDAWIRRKLRCYRLKQRKTCRSIVKFLVALGNNRRDAWKVAKSGKGWWRLSIAPPVQYAMNNAWFDKQGLISLRKKSTLLNV